MAIRVLWIFLVFALSYTSAEITEEVPKVNLAKIRIKQYETVNITCNVSGYPYSKISITHTHCGAINECNYERSLLSTEQKEINETISTSFDANSAGKITCRATNSKGSSEDSHHIIFTNDENDEDVSISSNRHMFSEGTYLDQLTCTVNSYTHERDNPWYKDGRQVRKIGRFEGVDVDFTLGSRKTNWQLGWYSNWGVYKHQQPGKYVCRAKHRLDGSITERVWWINQTNSASELAVEKVTQESIFARSKGEEVEFKVNFYGKSPWKINWLDKDDRRITWSNTESSYGRYGSQPEPNRFIATTEDDWAALKIVNLTSEDAGNYTFYVDDQEKRKEQTFELLVEDVPKLHVRAMHVKPNENANMSCQVIGYPHSDVSLTFTPCESEIKCLKEPTHMFTTKQTEYNQVFLMEVETLLGGFITCTAKNAKGQNKASAEYIVNDFEEDLIVNSTRQQHRGGYSDSLVCTASAFKYQKESLEWFQNGKKIEQSEGASLSEDSGSRHHSLTVSWSSEKEAYKPFENYTCRAKRLKDDSIEEKQWLVTKTKSDEPITYKLEGESFEFECISRNEYYDNDYYYERFQLPIIEIRWYKYGRKIEASNDAGIKFLDNNKTLSIPFIGGENEGKYSCVIIKKSSETHKEKVLKIRGSCDGGADIKFFQTLLPDVQSMSPSQKRDFKAKVVEALKTVFDSNENK